MKSKLLIANKLCPEQLLKSNIITEQVDAHTHLVYVLPKLPDICYQIMSLQYEQMSLYRQAKLHLSRIGRILGINKQHQWVRFGDQKREANKLALELQVG